MMKIGEAAKRLAQQDVLAPAGVDWALTVANRNFIIHQYDDLNRAITWSTIAVDLPKWKASLAPLFADADAAIENGSDDDSGSPDPSANGFDQGPSKTP